MEFSCSGALHLPPRQTSCRTLTRRPKVDKHAGLYRMNSPMPYIYTHTGQFQSSMPQQPTKRGDQWAGG